MTELPALSVIRYKTRAKPDASSERGMTISIIDPLFADIAKETDIELGRAIPCCHNKTEMLRLPVGF